MCEINNTYHVLQNVIVSSMEQSLPSTPAIQRPVSALANHRLRDAAVVNVKMVHSTYSVEVCSVVRIVAVISVDLLTVSVTSQPGNVNVIHELLVAPVRIH